MVQDLLLHIPIRLRRAAEKLKFVFGAKVHQRGVQTMLVIRPTELGPDLMEELEA